MKKLHFCCGDIYLQDYINCDIGGIILKGNHPNPTTLDKYFKDRKINKKQLTIIDKKFNLLKIPWKFKDNSIEEVVMISAIEHFTKKQANIIIGEIKRILKPKGRLIIDFPDLKENIKLYYKTNTEWCMELIYCNQKNLYSMHHWGYSFETFKKLLGSGWKSIEKKTVVKHSYPMTGVMGVKNE